MAVSKELLEILICPITKKSFRLAESAEVAELKHRLSTGHLKPVGEIDWKVEDVTGFLVTVDGSRAYPIVQDIPNLLPESGIVLHEGKE